MIDNYSLFEAHERDIERRTRHLPICCICNEHITSEYRYQIPGDSDWFCEDCWNDFVADDCRHINEDEEVW